MNLAIFGKKNSQNHFRRSLTQIFGRFRALWMILLAAFLLSGCVQYDIGVNFDSPNQGELVQHIKLGEQLASFNSGTAQQWLDSIERRAKQLDGKVRRVSKEEIAVTIPFSTGAELQTKFNQFFNPNQKKSNQPATNSGVNLPTNINSHLTVNQGNFIFWIRNKLTYDLDLRSLGVLSDNGTVLVSPESLIDLQFSVNAPWGAKAVGQNANAITPVSTQGNHPVWKLKPGQLNHLEVVFWLPNPLGIGTLIIVLITLAGYYLKYQRLPGSEIKTTQPEKAVVS